MSYDVRLEGVEFDTPHQIAGGTYAVGGTTEPWLNITYNYSQHFHKVLERGGVSGVRCIYGMTAVDSIPLLYKAIQQLGQDVDPDYWKPTEGNARRALEGLQSIATVGHLRHLPLYAKEQLTSHRMDM